MIGSELEKYGTRWAAEKIGQDDLSEKFFLLTRSDSCPMLIIGKENIFPSEADETFRTKVSPRQNVS